MRALITRPREDAEATAKALHARGIDTLVAPLIEIEQLAQTIDSAALESAQAILITSANGARALARVSRRRDLRLLCVGRASAEAARAMGFHRVESADGDGAALELLSQNRLDPQAGALIHVSGQDVAGDLAGQLTAKGFRVERCALYKARALNTLPAALATELTQRRLHLALFFSPRSAAIFVNLVTRAGLAQSCAAISAFGLSQAVKAALDGLPWRRNEAATRPEQDQLLASIDIWKKGSDR